MLFMDHKDFFDRLDISVLLGLWLSVQTDQNKFRLIYDHFTCRIHYMPFTTIISYRPLVTNTILNGAFVHTWLFLCAIHELTYCLDCVCADSQR